MLLLFKIVAFAIVSAGIVFLSGKSFRNTRSHGLFRFFAFELMLVLILLNLEHWFLDPFSTFQIVSWLLLLSSLILAVHGFYLLHVVGRPKSGVEDTTTLVITGAYKHIRHPLYASLLLLAWGLFFKDVALLNGILAVVASAFVVSTARAEESENLQRFGAEYAGYMKTTKMFIPFLI